jgi:hypothetical protein
MPSLILNSRVNLENGGVMVETKWESLSEVDPKREYIAFAEIGVRNSVWSFFSVIMRARKVVKQLRTTKGAVGVTAQLDFWSKKMAMVAAFEDEKTLMDFAHAGQHAQCREQFKDGAKWQRVKWSVMGSDIPLKIDDAIKRTQNKK